MYTFLEIESNVIEREEPHLQTGVVSSQMGSTVSEWSHVVVRPSWSFWPGLEWRYFPFGCPSAEVELAAIRWRPRGPTR